MTGKIYIASMNLRGEWALPIDISSIKVNVTSAQYKDSKDRMDFSPMTAINGGYNGFWNFEHYWQSGKVYDDISYEIARNWWLNLKKPKRRYPGSRDKRVLYAKWNEFYNKPMDYVTSRKKVYVPLYYDLVKDREMIKHYRELIKSGKNITIYDFDGPRSKDGIPLCKELTLDLLIEKINDVKFPFGHGYIVATLIKGIDYKEYI